MEIIVSKAVPFIYLVKSGENRSLKFLDEVLLPIYGSATGQN
jgi:hypothetical protein